MLDHNDIDLKISKTEEKQEVMEERKIEQKPEYE